MLVVGLPWDANAKVLTVKCEGPEGMRMDYRDNDFQGNADSISQATPVIVWNGSTRKGKYFFHDATGALRSTELTMVFSDRDSSTFTGVINRAPMLITFYPNDRIIYVSEHSTVSADNSVWPKATLFHSRCESAVN